MPSDAPVLPLPATLYRLLERVTEALAHEVATPGTPPPADWRATEWALAQAVAVMQGIGPLLATRSSWTGMAGWREFLEGQRRHTALRYARLAATAAQVDHEARTDGVSLVALKGMELHRLGLYTAGERPMADVDLLVADAGYPRAVAILERLGFTGGVEGWKDHLFVAGSAAPPSALGEHSANPVKIELHRHIVERLPWRPVKLPVSLLPTVPQPGLSPYPDLASLMLHLLLHAAGNMPTRTLRMIQLHDIARLGQHMAASDWQTMLQAAPPAGLWWAYPPLALTARYHGEAVPAAVLGALRAHCPARLARSAQRTRLFDTSHSYPWVEAFPGLGWSRTLRERATYMGNRIRPARDVQEKRQALVRSEAWSDRHWSQRSQWRRIARYLQGRQARPSTMHAVRLAFEAPV